MYNKFLYKKKICIHSFVVIYVVYYLVLSLQELKTKYDIVLEAKAKLEDEVDSLQSKVGLIGKLSSH